MAHLVDLDTLTARARERVATASPAILRFAATQPGGIAAWAEAPVLDGHGHVVDETPREDADDDLVQF